MKICNFQGCGRKLSGHGLCDSHLLQKRKGYNLTPIGQKRQAIRLGDLAYIPLKTGEYTVIDWYDWLQVSNHNWFKTKKGYASSTIGFLHNKIYDSEVQVDHVNGDRLDNRRINLREATNRQNQWNQQPRGTSVYKGVSARKGRWRARITVQGIQRQIGTFDTPERAAEAYNTAALAAFGEFACLNKIK